MIDFIMQAIIEFKSINTWCIIHGSEILVAVIIVYGLSFVLVLGMWLAALLSANKEDDDR